jgi:hypothetical protein
MYHKGSFMSLKMLKAAVAGLVLSVSGFANAGLIDVKSITISNALGQPLQVSEIIAWGTVSNSDLALSSLGATAVATGYLTGFEGSCYFAAADCVLDGSGPHSYWDSPYTYHGSSASDILTITLGSISELSHFTIFGRTDVASRDLYNVSFLNSDKDVLYTASVDARVNSIGRIDLPNTNVPEPSTLAIFALGIMGLASRRFKKQ